MKIEGFTNEEKLILAAQWAKKFGTDGACGGISVQNKVGDAEKDNGATVSVSAIPLFYCGSKDRITNENVITGAGDGEGLPTSVGRLRMHIEIYKRCPYIGTVFDMSLPVFGRYQAAKNTPPESLLPNTKPELTGEYCGTEEVEDIALLFENGSNYVLCDSFVIIAADDVLSAFHILERLVFLCALADEAVQRGKLRKLSGKHIEVYKLKTNLVMEDFKNEGNEAGEVEGRQKICTVCEKMYADGLVTSIHGTYSVRLSENSFVITPDGLDRRFLEVCDTSKIRDGKYEADTVPSCSAVFHAEVYKRIPSAKSLMIAYPKKLLAYAVTDAVHPAIPKLPFGSTFMQSALLAMELSEATPVVIIENDCVIAIGNDETDAYTRIIEAEKSCTKI